MWPYAATVTYAYAALVAGWWAQRHETVTSLTIAWALTAAMSAGFSAAWAVVAFTDVDRAVWSELVTPASTVFPLIFTLPATIALMTRRSRQ